MLNILQPISFNTFFKQVERVFGEVRLPSHFSKYSNKLYSNFVHVYLLIIKERHKCSYRDLTELLNDTNVLRMLGIPKLPHFTILQMFVSKISKNILQKLEYCWGNNITVHIPFRKPPNYQTVSDNRIKAMKRFRTKSYNKRSRRISNLRNQANNRRFCNCD